MSIVGGSVCGEELDAIAEELQRANYYPSGDNKNPERALLAAVLQRAIVDLLRPRHLVFSKLEMDRTRLWFLSKDVGPFTFLWICEQLDLQAPLILQALHKHFL